jgi:predicted porin
MNKRFLAIVIASTLASPLVANAGDANYKLYGRVHLSMDHVEVGSTPPSSTTPGTSLDFNSRKSAIGVKGKENLGGGMKVFFKMEWDVDMDDGTGSGGSGLGARDRYIGIKTSGMGVMKMGTLTTSYKETTAWVDPFWHTIAEGRGGSNSTLPALESSSGLAGGRGVDRGRGTDTFQYRSPKMGGMQMVVNRTYSGNGGIGENLGAGFRYTSKSIKAFLEYVDIKNTTTFTADETASKVGVKYSGGGMTVGLQAEQTEDLVGADFMLLSATYKVSESGKVLFSFGTKDAPSDDDSNSSFALGYNHGLSKRTNMYAIFAAKSDDDNTTLGSTDEDLSILSFGVKHTF